MQSTCVELIQNIGSFPIPVWRGFHCTKASVPCGTSLPGISTWFSRSVGKDLDFKSFGFYFVPVTVFNIGTREYGTFIRT